MDFSEEKSRILASWFTERHVVNEKKLSGHALGFISSSLRSDNPHMRKIVGLLSVGGGMSSHCVYFRLTTPLFRSFYIPLNKSLAMQNVENGSTSHSPKHEMVSGSIQTQSDTNLLQ
jgi:hypothetical protein